MTWCELPLEIRQKIGHIAIRQYMVDYYKKHFRCYTCNQDKMIEHAKIPSCVSCGDDSGTHRLSRTSCKHLCKTTTSYSRCYGCGRILCFECSNRHPNKMVTDSCEYLEPSWGCWVCQYPGTLCDIVGYCNECYPKYKCEQCLNMICASLSPFSIDECTVMRCCSCWNMYGDEAVPVDVTL